MSFQQKLMATTFLTAFMFGASWLLLAATILLNQPLDYAQQGNHRFVAGERGETIEILKEPIKLCSHDTKSGYKNCIPLEVMNSKALNQSADYNQAPSSDSANSSSESGRALYAVSWEATPEAQDSVVIELQDQSTTLLELNNSAIPQQDNKRLQNDESLLTTDVEEHKISQFNKSLIELTPTSVVLSNTEPLVLEESSDDSTSVNLEATTSETNAQAELSEGEAEGEGEGYFTESFYYYWFSSEETQE